MVRMRGLEPPRCHHHRLLRPARLPVPPHPHGGSHYANGLGVCQESVMLADNSTLIDHASTNSPAAITEEVFPRVATSPVAQYVIVENSITASRTRSQDITYSVTPWSATVPTSFAGVVAIYELGALLVAVRQPYRASRPTYVSDIAPSMATAATLTQCRSRDGNRQK